MQASYRMIIFPFWYLDQIKEKKIIGMFRARQRKIAMRALFVVIIQILWQLKKLKTGQYPLHTLFIGVAVIFWQ